MQRCWGGLEAFSARNPRSRLGCVLQTGLAFYRTVQWLNGEWDCVGSPHRELGSGILQMMDPRCRAGGRWAAAGQQSADFDEGVGLSARRPARPHPKLSPCHWCKAASSSVACKQAAFEAHAIRALHLTHLMQGCIKCCKWLHCAADGRPAWPPEHWLPLHRAASESSCS